MKIILRTINDAIDGFKELDELPWFDHDKIKSAKKREIVNLAQF